MPSYALCVCLNVCFVWLFGRDTRLGVAQTNCMCAAHEFALHCTCCSATVQAWQDTCLCLYVYVYRVCFILQAFIDMFRMYYGERVCVRVCTCVCLRECACIHNKSFYLEGIAARALWKWKIDQYSWIYYSQHLVEVSPLMRFIHTVFT